MARIQILELPEGASDDRPPFVLVIDQAGRVDLGRSVDYSDFGEKCGARATLISEETIELPGNWVEVDDDNVQHGTLRMKVEPVFDGWNEQIEAHAAETQKRLSAAMRTGQLGR